jgi:hypothetical protein
LGNLQKAANTERPVISGSFTHAATDSKTAYFNLQQQAAASCFSNEGVRAFVLGSAQKTSAFGKDASAAALMECAVNLHLLASQPGDKTDLNQAKDNLEALAKLFQKRPEISVVNLGLTNTSRYYAFDALTRQIDKLLETAPDGTNKTFDAIQLQLAENYLVDGLRGGVEASWGPLTAQSVKQVMQHANFSVAAGKALESQLKIAKAGGSSQSLGEFVRQTLKTLDLHRPGNNAGPAANDPVGPQGPRIQDHLRCCRGCGGGAVTNTATGGSVTINGLVSGEDVDRRVADALARLGISGSAQTPTSTTSATQRNDTHEQRDDAVGSRGSGSGSGNVNGNGNGSGNELTSDGTSTGHSFTLTPDNDSSTSVNDSSTDQFSVQASNDDSNTSATEVPGEQFSLSSAGDDSSTSVSNGSTDPSSTQNSSGDRDTSASDTLNGASSQQDNVDPLTASVNNLSTDQSSTQGLNPELDTSASDEFSPESSTQDADFDSDGLGNNVNTIPTPPPLPSSAPAQSADSASEPVIDVLQQSGADDSVSGQPSRRQQQLEAELLDPRSGTRVDHRQLPDSVVTHYGITPSDQQDDFFKEVSGAIQIGKNSAQEFILLKEKIKNGIGLSALQDEPGYQALKEVYPAFDLKLTRLVSSFERARGPIVEKSTALPMAVTHAASPVRAQEGPEVKASQAQTAVTLSDTAQANAARTAAEHQADLESGTADVKLLLRNMPKPAPFSVNPGNSSKQNLRALAGVFDVGFTAHGDFKSLVQELKEESPSWAVVKENPAFEALRKYNAAFNSGVERLLSEELRGNAHSDIHVTSYTGVNLTEGTNRYRYGNRSSRA